MLKPQESRKRGTSEGMEGKTSEIHAGKPDEEASKAEGKLERKRPHKKKLKKAAAKLREMESYVTKWTFTNSISVSPPSEAYTTEAAGQESMGMRVVTTSRLLPPTDFVNESHVSVVHVQPLLVLDLNGILCHRVRKDKEEDGVKYRKAICTVAMTPIIPRTDLESFLTYLDRHFCLAVWTSARAKTAALLVEQLFPQQIAQRLLFCWGQNKCRREISSGTQPTFHKNLQKVWNEYPFWNATNTLILDDSPEKFQQNFQNSLHPPALHGQKRLALNSRLVADEDNQAQQMAFFQKLVQHWTTRSPETFWNEYAVPNSEESDTLQEFLVRSCSEHSIQWYKQKADQV